MNLYSRLTVVDITGTFPHLTRLTTRMEANLLIIASEVVIYRDARRGSILFQARIPSSESKFVCAPAKRELGTCGRMTLFETMRLLLSKKSLEFTSLLACYIIKQNHFLLADKYELLRMSICMISILCVLPVTK